MLTPLRYASDPDDYLRKVVAEMQIGEAYATRDLFERYQALAKKKARIANITVFGRLLNRFEDVETIRATVDGVQVRAWRRFV